MFNNNQALYYQLDHNPEVQDHSDTQAYDWNYILSMPWDPNKIYDWDNIPSIPTLPNYLVDPTYLVAPFNPQPSDFGIHMTPNLGSYGLPDQYLGFTRDQLPGWSNREFAAPAAETRTTGLADDPWQVETSGVLGKRDRSPEPDLGMAKLDGLNSEDKVAKRAKIALRGEMEAQGSQALKLSVRQTPTSPNTKSKLGRCQVEASAVTPTQGISDPHPLGPTIVQSASGTPGDLRPAWNEGYGGVRGEMGSAGDTYDEEETDREREHRLMREVEGVWTCMGCNERFFDRSTLRRHCKSAAHRKDRDMKSCPYCPNEYLRQSSVNRHVRKHHSQNEAGEGAQDSSS